MAQLAVKIEDIWQLTGGTGKGGFSTLGDLVSNLLPKVLLLGGVVFFVMVVIAGFGIIAGAGGDDAQAKEKNKNFLTYAVIGLVIMFSAYWILQIINFITNKSLGGPEGIL